MKLKTIIEDTLDNHSIRLNFRRDSDDTLGWYMSEQHIAFKLQSFLAENMHLTSLEGGPIECHSFNVLGNELTSLIGGPTKIGFTYTVDENRLTSLEYAPVEVRFCNARKNKISSLTGIGRKYLKKCKILRMTDNDLQSNILGLLLIKDFEEMYCSNKASEKALDIVWRHIHKDKDVMDCQEELI